METFTAPRVGFALPFFRNPWRRWALLARGSSETSLFALAGVGVGGTYNMTFQNRSFEAQEWQKLYNRKRWKDLRRAQLRGQPLCERHLRRGKTVSATVVNHKIPHKGDTTLFFDPKNLESVCAPCHDSLIQKEEARGYTVGSSIDGRPADPKHPWNRT
ncbi:MAG: HNH endonuclease [Alphaproteobacteria bacterium]|nr:HNH endonuclease [Alphaproteobacteria bacterium]